MADRRPDLEAAPFKAPPFISDMIFPVMNVNVKAANPFYYADIQTDVTGQTSRSLTTAPTARTFASANTSFTCAEVIERVQEGESEVALTGGLEPSRAKMARKGKRGVGVHIEDKAVTATFGNGSITSADILGSFLARLDIAKETIMDNADGRIALFGAMRVINRLKRYDEVVERMSFTGVPAGNLRDVRSISDDQLAAAIGVDVVLPGPSTQWLGAASAYDGYLGLCVLPDESVDPDEEIQFGRRMVYVGDSLVEGNPYRVDSWYNETLRTEVIDVLVWSNTINLNNEACYIMTGIDEENTVTTTAS
jgi:hypothetical protein